MPSRERPVPWEVAVILAPTTFAPDLSRTVPEKLPLAWACDAGEKIRRHRHASTAKRNLLLMVHSPLQKPVVSAQSEIKIDGTIFLLAASSRAEKTFRRRRQWRRWHWLSPDRGLRFRNDRRARHCVRCRRGDWVRFLPGGSHRVFRHPHASLSWCESTNRLLSQWPAGRTLAYRRRF